MLKETPQRSLSRRRERSRRFRKLAGETRRWQRETGQEKIRIYPL